MVDPGGEGGDPSVADGVRKAADLLAEAGYVMEELDPPSLECSTQTIEQISD